MVVLRLFYGLLALASEMDTVSQAARGDGCSCEFHLSGDDSRDLCVKGTPDCDDDDDKCVTVVLGLFF